VIPLDGELQRVTFFDGPQLVLDAAVGPRGEVRATEIHAAGVPAAGGTLANDPWILALLSGLFLLATTVVPLRRLRNLDALVLAGLTATVVLDDARLVGTSVACASLALLYLTVRCVSIGLRAGDRPAATGTPLLTWMLARMEPPRRTRLLSGLVLAGALAFAMLTLSSSGYSDVAAASLEGATELLHGVLPYGHIALALHGDTYPLLSYLLYVPGALLAPVNSPSSHLSSSLAINLAAGAIAAAALYRIGASGEIPADGAEPPADRRLRLTLAWFAFAPVPLAASTGGNDLLVAACLAWMVALRTRAAASLLALAMGAWIKLVPLVLAAIWIPYRRRGLARRLAGAAALSVALTGLLVALGGTGAIAAMVKAMSFQFQRGSFFAPWYTFGLRWLQPLVQAGVLACLLAAVLRIRADPSVGGDPVRLCALASGLLLGVQLAANYWTWWYLPWVFPFLAVALFAAHRGSEVRHPPDEVHLAQEMTVSALPRSVSASHPLAPTTTRSSMRTPSTPGRYTPGSTVTTLPARSGSSSGAVRDRRGPS
jgi:Glycosyltransferase family 87